MPLLETFIITKFGKRKKQERSWRKLIWKMLGHEWNWRVIFKEKCRRKKVLKWLIFVIKETFDQINLISLLYKRLFNKRLIFSFRLLNILSINLLWEDFIHFSYEYVNKRLHSPASTFRYARFLYTKHQFYITVE